MTASLPNASDVASTNSTRTEAVRQTAARLFEAAGYSATTMNDIAEAVGVLPGSLYHHFRSKEDIAVELLLELNQALDECGVAASRRSDLAAADPEAAVRLLTTELTELSFRHAAAIRLRAHEAPPSVATARFAEAMQAQTPALDRAWRSTVGALATVRPAPPVDLTIVRFALRRLAFYAPVYYPGVATPRALGSHLCDIVLQGLVPDCPADEELDGSAALEAATSTIAGWRSPERPAAQGDRAEIVAAARSEFARRGYEATTIRDIANAADVRMGTLYRRVESKEALLREIIDDHGAHFEQAFQAVMSAGSTPPETLDGLARVFVHMSRRYREEARIVLYGWAQREATTSPLHEYYVATQRRLARLERLMQHGFSTGQIRRIADPTELSLHFRSLLWLPFHEHARTSEARAHAGLRWILLRGVLSQR
ncbi:helix-turn-helix domain-containing protein [Dactylosporangium sp. NPDC005572]|uniref:TetR/AcrR family transcriptional regulator n=1 Tax=Dactylosporangium sp. NPDC005572 TaxID=3156889 RepID=UPI0033B7D655